MSDTGNGSAKNPLKEIVQPFVDLVHAPRALWGVNLGYMLEGLVYFGMLGYLAMYFAEFVFKGVPNPDEAAHNMVMVLTAGITISMFFLGFVADKKGVRFALLAAFALMLLGRVLISSAPTVLGLEPAGMWSALHLVTLGGMLLVVLGYGMYQPAAYAAVRQFTTPKTATMGYAMLYAVMNLGGWFPTFAFLLRDEKFLGLGITGTFWVYTGITTVALVATALILTRRTVEQAIQAAEAEKALLKEKQEQSAEEGKEKPEEKGPGDNEGRIAPVQMWVLVAGIVAILWFKLDGQVRWISIAAAVALWLAANAVPASGRWLARHPLANGKFFFFIFAFIPVQTLFTYNWLVLPEYINRAFEGWIGEYFEIAANANPLLIFILVPVIAAATQKKNVYSMMIWGTLVMSLPAFLLAFGPTWYNLLGYIVLMTVGEAMWQPRFLQYAAEIAPKGRTGEYMGVAQFPWFLTKVLVPLLYSGWMMDKFCPAAAKQDPSLLHTETMWFIFGCIAISSTVMLVAAKPWMAKGFKTKSDD
ncbi:MAG: MFS transporter [Deltaproteobacteria bacterium]|nr:MAG: MFS transporter [Deltaproteobacteria bacterium]